MNSCKLWALQNILPFSGKLSKKKKHFINFIKCNILTKSVKKWLFLWWCFVGFFQMYNFVHLQCLQYLSQFGFGHVQKHCTSATVSSCPEIPLGENARVQNPEQNLVLRHCFKYFLFLAFQLYR